ncbi:MAG: DUF2207 domain-containing protein [Vitreimonas sp.]
MKRMLALLATILAIGIAAPASAKELIDQFNVRVDVARNGDIVVTETIDLIAEGDQIRHGINRDLPRYYTDASGRLPYAYDILRIERDGHAEHYQTSHDGNDFRVRIGNGDEILSAGAHEYVVRYRVHRQVRRFERYDEVYWNATGSYWTFPILHARAIIALPPGANVTQTAGYTGAFGEKGQDFTYSRSGDEHVFTATRALGAGEGLSVAVGFAKGLIDPPSRADQTWLWWQRNGALAILLLSIAGLSWFLYRAYDQVGRDPVKGPVFARYEPPADYSPAATHYIFYRGLRENRALIATIMNLAMKGRLTIDASDKKATTLTAARNPPSAGAFASEDLALERSVFAEADVKTLGGQYDSAFTEAYEKFRERLAAKYGSAYFRWNAGYTILAILATVAVVVLAALSASQWTGWDTLAVLALAALNIAFMYFIPAPSQLGQDIRTQIEGFRLYMETAEKLQLNAVEVGSEAPPPMTTQRYETFLPYAVALGVEAPWTHHFERLLPKEAASYSPAWAVGGWSSSHAFTGMSQALVSNMNSGVSSAMPQSSSSSGSGGGGFSGGGGGGGGGSGW